MTPVACVWLSNRAGDGGTGIVASVDKLSRTVPITRVLKTKKHKKVSRPPTMLCCKDVMRPVKVDDILVAVKR